jgi:hypothetical protein
MKFEPGDFEYMAENLRLGRWSGENLEWLYSMACGGDRGTENPSAVQSIEKHLKREPFLWAEKTKTPTRLFVWAELTWKGERVKVTSFNDGKHSLVACAYANSDDDERDEVGSVTYLMGEYRKVEAKCKMRGGAIAFRVSAKVAGAEDRKPKKRFTITLEEMKAVRKDYDTRRRACEKEILAATTLDELEAARIRAAAHGQQAYRHFDLDILRDAIAARREAIEEGMSAEQTRQHQLKIDATLAANLDRWAAGEDVRDYLHGHIRIRVKGDYVEVSNGNKVTVKAAKTALRFVAKHRAEGWSANGQSHDVDAFPMRSMDAGGVEIGCTLIPWPEVERCAQLLGVA